MLESFQYIQCRSRVANHLILNTPGSVVPDVLSPLGSPIVLQRKGSVYGSNVPMITELVNDSNVQFLDQVSCDWSTAVTWQQCWPLIGPGWWRWPRHWALPHPTIRMRHRLRCQCSRLPHVHGEQLHSLVLTSWADATLWLTLAS